MAYSTWYTLEVAVTIILLFCAVSVIWSESGIVGQVQLPAELVIAFAINQKNARRL